MSKGGTRRKPSMVADILALSQGNMNGNRIAKHLGCTRGYVSQVLSRNRNSVKAPHSLFEPWQKPARGRCCEEHVFGADGKLKPCGEPKYMIGNTMMGQCEKHFHAQVPFPRHHQRNQISA